MVSLSLARLVASLVLVASHVLAAAQIQKCSYSCKAYDRRWDFPNTLLQVRFTPGNILECEYGYNPGHTCRYSGVNGTRIPGNSDYCQPKAEDPSCGPSHPAGTMCQSYCSKGNIQPWGPQDTEFVCNKYCHYDLNSGVLLRTDREHISTSCPSLASNTNCAQEPDQLPAGWSVAIPCAGRHSGTGSDVMPGNVSVPLLSLGDGYKIQAGHCVHHCASFGRTVAAVENADRCYCSFKIAEDAKSVDPSECQTRCATPEHGSLYSCGGKNRLQVYTSLPVPACKQPNCPEDLTGSSGALITVKNTLFTCAYPQGSCTWLNNNGALKNTGQVNCPKTVQC